MPDFQSSLANFISCGAEVEGNADGSWTRSLIRVPYLGHEIIIRQQRNIVNSRASDFRGKSVHSSTVKISNVHSFEQGADIARDLAALLSLTNQSHVIAYAFDFEGHGKTGVSGPGFVGGWRTCFGPESNRLADFLEQVLPQFARLREPRALRELIQLIVRCDYPDTPIEVKAAQIMICLENIKTFWALHVGQKNGIIEKTNGAFARRSNPTGYLNFETLLLMALDDIGMSRPSRLTKIIKFRNALLHRGIIRPQDAIVKSILGKAPSRRDLSLEILDIYKDAQDILYEYLFRLLGFRGQFHNYSVPYGRGDWTSI